MLMQQSPHRNVILYTILNYTKTTAPKLKQCLINVQILVCVRWSVQLTVLQYLPPARIGKPLIGEVNNTGGSLTWGRDGNTMHYGNKAR